MNPETTCRYCPAKIRWVTLPSGKRMPIDAKPVTVVILRQPADGWKLNGSPWARTAQAWMPHFATCPNYPTERRSSPRDQKDYQEAVSQTALALVEEEEKRHP